eukprot:CAMPEP_0170499622 /NCGR_PEP_ID=MMETSP0208-20121228/32032_1 /TAXON_ID=197538 /ORGANISM="Strombidium inclinatum, Strain S3" /LENGTH=163 /DNA_ID=CAMNT_0010777257 /DNA_START=809 /DNA_END=1297 /DNA_ORIENTATION=+
MTISYLLHDVISTDSKSSFALDVLLVFGAEGLQAFNFHHDVKLLLFIKVLSLEDLRLFKLLISHSDDFSVESHLVHYLDVIKLLVSLHLGFSQDALCSLLLFKAKLRRLLSLRPPLVKICHSRLPQGGKLDFISESFLPLLLLGSILFLADNNVVTNGVKLAW